MAFIQQTFRHEGVDGLSGENSHRYGRSTQPTKYATTDSDNSIIV